MTVAEAVRRRSQGPISSATEELVSTLEILALHSCSAKEMPRPFNPLEVELAAETAATLGRNGKQLRKTLDALREFDAEVAAGRMQRGDPATRARLVRESADAFWGYVVQRELLGVQDAAYIAREYAVPAEVLAIAGTRKQE
jgi:hypothetical protein